MLDWINQLVTVVRSKTPLKLLVAGSRDINQRRFIKAFLMHMTQPTMYPDLVLVNGLARGVDRDAKEVADELGITVEPYPADWNGPHGRGAGAVRNRQMGDATDAGLALWDGASKGTADMISYMHKLNKPMMVIT
jgi:hypothetical protein